MSLIFSTRTKWPNRRKRTDRICQILQKIHLVLFPVSRSIIWLSLRQLEEKKFAMQNFLTTRYRRVHNKIKDVRLSDFKYKFSKGIKQIKELGQHIESLPLLSKFSVLGTKITQFPYQDYWQKSLPYRYWTFGLIVCLPVFYQFRSVAKANAKLNREKLEMFRQNIEGQTEGNEIRK